ncbi:WD repeat-containing protein 74 [Ischnura elegans]|uniref:WD repeat-containing protein 74 n=1 Tax=Ischnura elegans TaxID=197161 RepID=UPI001ED8BAFE|nr:WD repeat-containing protein 74 [Ischnura elegans]
MCAKNMSYKSDLNVFVGAKTGILKGVKLCENVAIEKNLNGLNLNPREDEISAIGWGDSEEKEILLGLANQVVKVYDSEHLAFTSSLNTKCGEGTIRGVSRCNKSIVTAVESGEVSLWSDGESAKLEETIKTGPCLERMRHSSYDREIIAVGGKESDLSLWNLEAKEKCVFRAKNVPHNHLQLRVPIWVSDMAFLPGSQKVVTCSRYGHLRLYDPKAQRRPVLNMEIPEQALTTISACNKENHIVVGSGTGLMMLVDLRGKGLQMHHYKGFVGGIRDIACHPTDPYILSVSLDRFLRLHNLNTKALLHKVYLKSKLNCVLMRSDFSLKEVKIEKSYENDEVEELLIPNDPQDEKEAAKEMDLIFNEMDSAATRKSSKSKSIKSIDSKCLSKRKLEKTQFPPLKKKKKQKEVI